MTSPEGLKQALDDLTKGSIEVLPEQLPVRLEFFDGGVSIDQTGGPGGDQSIWISGRANLDLLIAALHQAREALR